MLPYSLALSLILFFVFLLQLVLFIYLTLLKEDYSNGYFSEIS